MTSATSWGARVASLASLVADELLSNALHDAPVDAAGAPRYADAPRDQPRHLTDRERVTLRYACDGRYLAIEVTDWWGSLREETVLRHLAKATSRSPSEGIEFRAGGAGMGVALAYSCCHHLIYNLDYG